VVPTVIDCDYYQPAPRALTQSTSVCIGWTGSSSTVAHLRLLDPVFKVIRERFGESVSFRFVGSPGIASSVEGAQVIEWDSQAEVHDLSRFDIGVMPLPYDEWSEGKCGCKLLQYMAMGIPAVASPVGVNQQIVQHGHTGLLARTLEDWVHTLSELILDPALRQQLGDNARTRAVNHYSVESQWPQFWSLLTSVGR
jgi:glycosyltransferase involved in cell wall biosynthesis